MIRAPRGSSRPRHRPEDVLAGVDLLAQDEDERGGGARLGERLPDVERFLLNEGVAESLVDELSNEDDQEIGTDAHRQKQLLHRAQRLQQTERKKNHLL